MQFKAIATVIAAIYPSLVSAQGSAVITGGGYTAPAPLAVSPGQLITIFVSGIGSGITQRVSAASFPLPKTLAGISASMVQLTGGPPGPIQIPLLAIYPSDTCGGISNVQPCSRLLGITLQIPYELSPNIPGFFGPPNTAEITVSDGANTTGGFGLNPVSNQIHVLRSGDTVAGDGSGFGQPLVTHADGSPVSPGSPAKVGEILTVYVVGLGRTDSRAITGEAAPLPPPGSSFQIPLVFDFRPNATPSGMLTGQATSSQGGTIQSASLFAGLTPGYAGLYQVNFQVPAAPVPIAACGNSVNSNVTVNLIGSTGFGIPSFDGAPICIAADTAQ